MSDYIKREDAIKAFDPNQRRDWYTPWIVETLKDLPLADVAPVRHGWWQITDAYPHNVYCSECHTKYAQTHWGVWEDGSLPRRYCPCCGSKMDEEVEA